MSSQKFELVIYSVKCLYPHQKNYLFWSFQPSNLKSGVSQICNTQALNLGRQWALNIWLKR